MDPQIKEKKTISPERIANAGVIGEGRRGGEQQKMYRSIK